MKEQTVRLGPREQQIVELLLQGCDNAEIASQLKMARRTVKAHFNRLFLRFGITGGIKRVKLATLLYRRQSCLQVNKLWAPVSQVEREHRSHPTRCRRLKEQRSGGCHRDDRACRKELPARGLRQTRALESRRTRALV